MNITGFASRICNSSWETAAQFYSNVKERVNLWMGFQDQDEEGCLSRLRGRICRKEPEEVEESESEKSDSEPGTPRMSDRLKSIRKERLFDLQMKSDLIKRLLSLAILREDQIAHIIEFIRNENLNNYDSQLLIDLAKFLARNPYWEVETEFDKVIAALSKTDAENFKVQLADLLKILGAHDNIRRMYKFFEEIDLSFMDNRKIKFVLSLAVEQKKLKIIQNLQPIIKDRISCGELDKSFLWDEIKRDPITHELVNLLFTRAPRKKD